MGIGKQIAEYLFIKKPDPKEPRTTMMKYMHGMNRISLIILKARVCSPADDAYSNSFKA